MAKMTVDDLKDAQSHCNDTKQDFDKSKVAGCFCCCAIFDPKEIRCWISGEYCPECPRCGIDSVIGDSSGYEITPDFLEQMRKHWFGGELPDVFKKSLEKEKIVKK